MSKTAATQFSKNEYRKMKELVAKPYKRQLAHHDAMDRLYFELSEYFGRISYKAFMAEMRDLGGKPATLCKEKHGCHYCEVWQQQAAPRHIKSITAPTASDISIFQRGGSGYLRSIQITTKCGSKLNVQALGVIRGIQGKRGGSALEIMMNNKRVYIFPNEISKIVIK